MRYIITAIVLMSIMTGCAGVYDSTPEWSCGPIPLIVVKF